MNEKKMRKAISKAIDELVLDELNKIKDQNPTISYEYLFNLLTKDGIKTHISLDGLVEVYFDLPINSHFYFDLKDIFVELTIEYVSNLDIVYYKNGEEICRFSPKMKDEKNGWNRNRARAKKNNRWIAIR